jgi:hypothetical protein
MIDYHAIAAAGGIPKPHPKKKPRKSPNKGLKRTIHPVPKKVKEQALEKSAFCFCGLCPVCRGLPVTVDDDPHHYPRKGSQGGRDIPEHIWMCKRICHSYMHDHPLVEKEMFQRIEAAGYFVDWGAKKLGKKI